ncbi:DNA polymerase III subunit gamma/tau [Coleofasciculus sp. G2-EDA-02]|uniref:DNA polymerase III subunit gamma/tau n=1 Tax=Coleofasciculus sp. G2-EDA-02 TaxID=3069529 RepID=UPI0032F20302
MSYEPLHHKYRPQTFADLVGQEAIAQTLTNAIVQEKIAPAYLFCGPRGTGKTSSARILAKSLNCLTTDKPTPQPCGTCDVCRTIAQGTALDITEIDAASNTGVDNIREIIERAQFAPVQCRYKVYVVDECHMLSSAAFNALLKTLEEPPKHVVFVLATTDPQRVLPTIISRCQRFDFRRIPLAAMVKHLQVIATKETINITTDAITLVAQVAQGGLRDAESLLDQLSLLAGEITVECIWDLVGAVPERDLLALSQAIASNDAQVVLDCCRNLMDRGREPLVVLQNLAGFYRDLLIAKTAPNRQNLVAVTPPTWKQLCEFAQTLDTADILRGQQHLKASEAQVKNTTQPRLWLEVTLLGLLPNALRVEPGATQTRSHQPPSQVSQPRTTQPPEPQHRTTQPASPPLAASQTPAAKPISQIPETQPPPRVKASESPPPSSNNGTVSPVPVSEQSADTEQIWKQIIENLRPTSVKEFLRQMGHLLSFDGTVAQIGFTTKPLLQYAKDNLQNIQAAFEAVYQKPIKVNFTVIGSKSAKPTATNREVVTPSESNLSSNVEDETPKEDKRDQGDREDRGMVIPQPERHIPQPNQTQFDRAEENMPISLPQSSISAPVDAGDWDEEKIQDAVTTLTKFFSGNVITLDDELNMPELEASSSTEDTKQMHSLQSQSLNDTASTAIQEKPTQGKTPNNSTLPFHRSDTLKYDDDGDIAF